MKTPAFLLCGLAGLAVYSFAQTPQSGGTPPAGGRVTDSPNQIRYWDCTTPGGNYTVSLGNISSVSVHDFNVTGGRVTEVTIDTNGSVVARFYYMEPAKIGSGLAVTSVIKERVEQVAETVAERTGSAQTWKQVQKDYPIATHAHTVEYRLQNREDVLAIHSSAKSAWMSGQGRSIRIVE